MSRKKEEKMRKKNKWSNKTSTSPINCSNKFALYSIEVQKSKKREKREKERKREERREEEREERREKREKREKRNQSNSLLTKNFRSNRH